MGAGKTGIAACLWLLRNGIQPERLTWIMPRDAWLMDRANILITLPSLRGCQPVFSAALTAHVEANYHDDAQRNDLCAPVPHPNTDLDWLTTTTAEHRNQIRWLDDSDLMQWLCAARLDLMRHMYAPLMDKPKVRDKVFGLIKAGLESRARSWTLCLSQTAQHGR